MSDQIQTSPSGGVPDISVQCTPLPAWLADRVLQANEKITWLFGPRFNPPWERQVTHPTLFLAGLALGALCLLAGRLSVGSWAQLPPLFALFAAVFVLGPIFVLGLSSAYFTRLVVTDCRLLILQGREVCRAWSIDQLPRSLIRYGMAGGRPSNRTVDLEALKTMLGGSSDKFTTKTILAVSKQLDQIKARENDRP
jgi:hypothetical protein